MSVSIGPGRTAETLTPRLARSARNDCVSESEAAFEIEYAGSTGTAASALSETMLTTVPRLRLRAGTNALVTSIQLLLVRLGYDPGTPIGTLGVKTNMAIAAFQKSQGESVQRQCS